MRSTPFWWFLLGFMVLLDIYVFQIVKFLLPSGNPRMKTIVISSYWFISVFAIVALILLPYLSYTNAAKWMRTTIFAMIAGLFFAKLVASLFFLVDDVRRGVQWIAGKLFSSAKPEQLITEKGISRSTFLSWVGLVAGGGLFGTLIYGFSNKYNYQLKKIQLAFEKTPSAFKGLKIVHISDIHSGSFTDKKAVEKGVQKILDAQPDLILFTGDLVNNISEEMKDYTDIFSKLKAPMGVYSTLGNHDYGDYAKWDSPADKEANLEELKNIHAGMGWRLLMDENIELEKDGHAISLIGVQNISGKGRFHSYGDFKKAYQGVNNANFKILMSHDPSHWDAEVRKTDVDLTLSGHTHGMQFGVEIPGFKWSPVQYMYKQWAGLYEADNQKLYINRGFGFIGYPGRVGILPEITLIELV